jgi:hypothetical protein
MEERKKRGARSSKSNMVQRLINMCDKIYEDEAAKDGDGLPVIVPTSPKL